MGINCDYIFHFVIYVIHMPLSFIFSCLLIPPLLTFRLITTIFGYFSKENMNGKVVLITGASSGIGEQMAYDYAKRGACLVIAARRDNRLKEVAKKALSFGSPDVLSVRTNVSSIDDCKRVVNEAINHFGRLDHLVNNAGVVSVVQFELIKDISKFQTIMDTNFWGPAYLIHFAVPHLRRSKGRIIIISSVGVLNPPTLSLYTASKAALDSLCNVLRVELAPEIKMTTVSLGFIESEMTEGKHMNKEGTMQVQPEIFGNMLRFIFPSMGAKTCSSAVVRAICRGQKHVIVPKWYSAYFMKNILCPEFLEWIYHLYFYYQKESRSLSD